MIIGAWDLGQSTGVAVGGPDRAPILTTVRMPDPIGGSFSRTMDCFMKWADEWLAVHRPGRLYLEAPFAAQRRTGADLTDYIRNQFVYAGVADGLCFRHGIPCYEVRVQHVRQHFTDNGGAKDHEIAAVFKEVLGVKPADTHQADAFSLWHFAVVDQLDLPTPFVLPHHREVA